MFASAWFAGGRHTRRVARRPRIEVSAFGRIVSLRVHDRAALEVVREVFLDDVYRGASTATPAPTILDLGSHVGASALYFHARYPDATIHAFEPDPDNFALLVANTRHIRGVTAHNAAVAGSTGPRTLWHDGESWTPTLSSAGRRRRSVAVDAWGLDTVLDRLALERVDVLKLDVEGAEYEVAAASELLARCETICGEVHFDLSNASVDDWRALLADYEVELDAVSENRALMVARRLPGSGGRRPGRVRY